MKYYMCISICSLLFFSACKKETIDSQSASQRFSSAIVYKWKFIKAVRVLFNEKGQKLEDLGTLTGVDGDYIEFDENGNMRYDIQYFQANKGTYRVISANEVDLNVEGFGLSHSLVDVFDDTNFIFTDRFYRPDGNYVVSQYFLTR